jgi:hypothetical protein
VNRTKMSIQRGPTVVTLLLAHAEATPYFVFYAGKEVRMIISDMIISDTSFLPLPGKDAEAVAAFKETSWTSQARPGGSTSFP